MHYPISNKKTQPRQEYSNIWAISKQINSAKSLAAEKGLALNKDAIVGGWIVITLDGKEVHCPTPASLSRFVKEYKEEIK